MLDSNLFTHRNTCYFEKPLVNTMAPGSTRHHIFSLILFTSLHFPPSDLTLQTILKGLTTPLKHWVQACLCLRRYSGLDEALLLDRYLGSQTDGNTYCSCAASPFPLQGKNQRKLKRRRKVSVAVAKGFLVPLPGIALIGMLLPPSESFRTLPNEL